MGKIYFLLVRIKLKHMEIAIIKRESTGSGELVENYLPNISLFRELCEFRHDNCNGQTDTNEVLYE